MNAPRIVLLPGLDGTGDLFDPLVEALTPNVASTVMRYTSPPLSRYSECRAAVLARLPNDLPYVLLGESFSGPIAISIAAVQPPGLCGLVLAGSFALSPSLMLRYLGAFIGLLPTHSTPLWASDFFLLGRFANPGLRGRVVSAMAQVAPKVVRARLREIASVDVSAQMRDIGVPILYLRATEDRLVPRSSGDRIASLSTRVRIVDIEAPHLLLQCAPHESAAAISGFTRDCCRANVI